MIDIRKLQKDWKPRSNTGKTRFNREKAHGESWTDLREEKWGPDYVCSETWVKR